MADTSGERGAVRTVVAGVEVDAYYSDGRYQIPEGVLTRVALLLTRQPRRGRGGPTPNDAFVSVAQIDTETGMPVRWWVGLPSCGWVNGVTWATVEDAVKAVRTPGVADRLAEFDRLTRESYAAEDRARNLRDQADALRDKVLAEVGGFS